MNTITLQSLSIENFKGCRRLVLTFDGKNANIFGDNASGKSTIHHAFSWLLFDKDADGRTNYQIKPLGKDGQVLDHAAVTTVEAIMNVDGIRMSLRKCYYERWATKRGSAEASFDGHTSEYFVDDVPVKKNEFESRVAALVPEEIFRILTHVTYFSQTMDWRKRRDTLFEICALPDDKAIMATDPKFEPLAAAMGSLSMDDFKRKLAAERKGLSNVRNSVPARIDEQNKTVEALASIDFASIRAQRDEASRKCDALQSELLKLSHGALIDAKRNELTAVQNEIAAEINRNTSHRQSQMVPIEDRRPALNAAIEKAKAEQLRWGNLEKKEVDLIAQYDFQNQNCRNLWAAADARVFSAESCPTCGQTLPEAAQKAALARFEAEKVKAKDDAISRADGAKQSKAAAEYRRDECSKAASLAGMEVSKLTAELAAYVPETQPEITDLPDHATKLAALQEKMRILNEEIQTMVSETAAIRTEINQKITNLQAEINRLAGEISKESMLAFARERAETLREDAKKAAAELAAVDRQIFLCEEFTRFKVAFVEDTINSHFKMAKWKLYETQVNGGIADCCEATYDGVPFAALNSGAKINVGLDIVRALSEHYALRVPLFIDNAESVTSLLPTDTQVIRLVVSKNDKELRPEYEN